MARHTSVSDAKEKKKRVRQLLKINGSVGSKKKRQRENSWDYEDDDKDVEFEAQDSESEVEEKPKKKRGRPRKNQVETTQENELLRKKKKGKKEVTKEDGLKEEEEEDRVLLEKHRNRVQHMEQDSGQVLEEVRDLAMEEKKMQEKLTEKLKRDITTLSKQAEEARKKNRKEVDRLVAEKMREYEAQEKRKSEKDVEKIALREHIKELESQFASFKRSTGPNDVVTVNPAAVSAASAMQNSEAIIQLDQANKLLEVYRLVTSTDIRLIQAIDDDEQDSDDCTEIVCTATDSATGNQFEFELAVPAVVSSEIEYLPSEKPPTGVQVPSYLREELSFSRSEVTKFFRSVLDVIIRKKKL
ncbi:hypothetical protein DD237_002811 [Peronospora effusa]|uniref:Monopolin complex subunit Csm1/Pcs1 C-terminal domain-containing protein n=1 Tax=Peronospora effusa TaxID=542832 RepID=A0A3R7YTS1_9STRA|nr:hypothetical protein DD237_002811 [Peronospora effusa]